MLSTLVIILAKSHGTLRPFFFFLPFFSSQVCDGEATNCPLKSGLGLLEHASNVWLKALQFLSIGLYKGVGKVESGVLYMACKILDIYLWLLKSLK